ncbi:phosphohistidine phosphatase SixA [Marinobacter sp. X15-166B]|uniref:phosphohistidine phosphatase SixA n=1 Tax=Marinobacter sp. X15-166B TaxID=1897620 RepID=UPI00085C58C3|nr:phosphohistidine phosphatase SixA [Marinobacter sp. X15-166B]OEY67631.1 phosphohistidine phosphatase SixA [Marinobacter sp. X15-166B]
MHVLIMRHGEAGWHSLDEQRELTEQGRQATAKVARDIASSPWRPNLIWCSPLIRARQTAGIVAEILNCPVEEKEGITPEGDPGQFLDQLITTRQQSLMIVSHMPFVGALSTLMIDGHRRGIPFMTSHAVVLDMPIAGPGCADLREQFLP